MAPIVAITCAASNDMIAGASNAIRMPRCTAMPVNPTRQNSRKRGDTALPLSLAVTSVAKSSAVLLSSLLSPS